MADIDWLDIGLHVLVALPWGVGAGVAARLGRRYGGWPGELLAAGGLLSALTGALFWAVRELDQHGHEWGGIQSQIEWLAPALVILAAYGIVGWLIPDRRRL